MLTFNWLKPLQSLLVIENRLIDTIDKIGYRLIYEYITDNRFKLLN